MERPDVMKRAIRHHVQLGGRRVEYRVVCSSAARKMRVRVGLSGVEVVQPAARNGQDVSSFLNTHEAWILDQLRRVDRLRGAVRSQERRAGEIIFRGEPTRVRIVATAARRWGNKVSIADGEIIVERGMESRTPVARSLENWLRKQARREIERHLPVLAMRLRQTPGRVYVMGQRTKWGNCSAERNLSFNWRLILAPEFVIRYLITHEAVHLAIPDHSAKFWLTVQSLCRETERAKQWLCRHQVQLQVDLAIVLEGHLRAGVRQ
jgi:predicted metal-dependent hydrolase